MSTERVDMIAAKDLTKVKDPRVPAAAKGTALRVPKQWAAEFEKEGWAKKATAAEMKKAAEGAGS